MEDSVATELSVVYASEHLQFIIGTANVNGAFDRTLVEYAGNDNNMNTWISTKSFFDSNPTQISLEFLVYKGVGGSISCGPPS